jgi:hypothetical protein
VQGEEDLLILNLFSNEVRKGEFSEDVLDHECESGRKAAVAGVVRGIGSQINILILLIKSRICATWETVPKALSFIHRNRLKSSCALCSAVAYCCGAVALRVIAALLGRFLPRLGPLVYSSGPFFLQPSFLQPSSSFERDEGRDHSAADWNGPRSSSGTAASASASRAKSSATCANLAPRSRRRSSM